MIGLKRYMRKLVLFILLSFPLYVYSNSLYIDNFNDSSSPNLRSGSYASHQWGGGTSSLSYLENNAFGNNGYSLQYTYNLFDNDDGAMFWMNLQESPPGTIITTDLTLYDYLSFWVKGEVGGEVVRITMKERTTVQESSWVDIRNYIPGGIVTTSWQKVVIPLAALRFTNMAETDVGAIIFKTEYTNYGLSFFSGIIYLDEIILSTGASPIYIDTMEVDELILTTWGVDINALTYDIFTGSNAGVPGSYSRKTNTIETDKTNYLGQASYKLEQGRPNITGSGYAVWMLSPTGLDVSACNNIQFQIKSAWNRSIYRGPVIHLDDAGYNDFEYMPIALNSSWQEVNLDLNGYGTDLNKSSLLNFKLATEWDRDLNNLFWVDEIKFTDNISPQSPTNIRVNGNVLTNNSQFLINNKISATVFSNETFDSSLEGVMAEYRKNNGIWKLIGIDYNTDKKDFTNSWTASGFFSTDKIDIRVSSIDSSTNKVSVIITNCHLPSSSEFASCDMSIDPPDDDGVSLYTGATYYTNSIGGSGARRTFGSWASLTFDVNSTFAEKVSNNQYYYVIGLEYFDIGVNKQFSFIYDNRENLSASVNLKEIALPKMKNTMKWKTNYTLINDAYWGDRANGADFLIKGEDIIYIRKVLLYKISSASNTAVSLRLSASDTDMAVGALNKINVEAVNDFGFRDVFASGSVNVTASGNAEADKSSVSLVNGMGSFYVSSSIQENSIISALKTGLNPGTLNVSFKLFYGLNHDKKVSITFTNPVSNDGIYLDEISASSTVVDGQNVYRTADGEYKYMLLDIDNDFVYNREENDGYIFDIIIEYFDIYTGPLDDINKSGILLKYDSIGMTKGSDGYYVWELAQQKAPRNNSGTWKTYTYSIMDPMFADRLDNKGDFVLTAYDPIYIRKITVSKRNYYKLAKGGEVEIKAPFANLTIKKNSTLSDYYIIPYCYKKLNDSKAPRTGLSYSIKNKELITGSDFIVYDWGFNKVEDLHLKNVANLELLYRRENISSDINENNLSIYYYNKNKWEKKGGDIDLDAQKISVNINHLSTYAIFESNPGNDFIIKWEYNPFSPNKDGIMDKGMLHVVLPEKVDNVRVFIYSLKGSFVKELPRHQSSAGQLFEWDGKNQRNKNVPIGPYIYQVEYGDNVYNGIIGVVR